MPHTPTADMVGADLEALLRVARRTGSTLRIEGAPARALLDAFDGGSPDPLDVLRHLPPLSEFELCVSSPPGLDVPVDILSEIRRELPVSGFFPWSTMIVGRQSSRRLKHVRVVGPAVILVPGVEALASVVASDSSLPALVLGLDDHGSPHLERIGKEGRPQVGWEGGAISDTGSVALLNDLLYVATTFPDSDDDQGVLSGIVAALSQRGGESVAADLKTDPHPNTAAHFKLAFLRYIVSAAALARTLRATAPLAAPALHRQERLSDFWPAFLEHSGVEKAALQALNAGWGFRTAVVPRRVGGVWRRQVDGFVSGAEARIAFSSPAGGSPSESPVDPYHPRVTTPVQIQVDSPSVPDCSLYSDFSRGIGEIVWVAAEEDDVPEVDKQLLAVVQLDEVSDPPLAHSFLTRTDRMLTLRLDYGFLCCLAGRERSLGVSAAWTVESPGSATDTPPRAGASL